ncbi:MAG TPA: hypothetical protein VFA29_06835 [Candidatus Baltobacteraceae bacterium]|nr:hypothetical protein [Candidatus Baltobacteraceae bacterium]
MSGFNGLLVGAELLFVPAAIAAFVALTADVVRRIVAAQLAGLLVAIQLVLLSVVFANPSFCELGEAMALLSIGGGLLFAHFLDRWL